MQRGVAFAVSSRIVVIVRVATLISADSEFIADFRAAPRMLLVFSFSFIRLNENIVVSTRNHDSRKDEIIVRMKRVSLSD